MATNPVESVLLKGFAQTGVTSARQQNLILKGYGALETLYIKTHSRRAVTFTASPKASFTTRVTVGTTARPKAPFTTRRKIGF